MLQRAKSDEGQELGSIGDIMKKAKTAISPTRNEDYPEWYQQIIKEAQLAEQSPVRGCMVIKPWGFGLWENIKQQFDTRFKATDHENAYFPLFIPLSFLEKEAEHVEGFAKECAVVTHHRLESGEDGKLVPAGKLEEPLVVRPTSETIIGATFAKWVQSYRDLPLLINQWANVVRWEMRTRMFLRTSEFLWQEGHTVHASEAEAVDETMQMLDVYAECIENELAIPVIKGEKSAGERFPGAVATYAVEAMMQDCKALQAGTSHYLGQNFAKASQIMFLDQDGEQKYAHTTSWGVSTRLIGGLIMTHADDDGMRVPPYIAPKHIVILPVIPKEESRAEVEQYASSVAAQLSKLVYRGSPLVVELDNRDLRGGEKNWQWVKKGIPLRVELGPRDIAENKVVLHRRDQETGQKHFMSVDELCSKVVQVLDEIQANYFAQAKEFLEKNTHRDIEGFAALSEFFKDGARGGFVIAPWCEDAKCENKLGELKTSIRCLPLEQPAKLGSCVVCGKSAKKQAVIARAY